MKRSKLISLVLLASTTLVACSEDRGSRTTSREVYKTREDCIRDWDRADNCQRRMTGGGYQGPHYFFYGGNSYYIPPGSEKPQPMSSSMVHHSETLGSRRSHSISTHETTHIVRGGFGASSLHHSSVS
ncbi:MAG: hypothetical protein H7844_10040 [Nitrospirae bacterium YQR-1]